MGQPVQAVGMPWFDAEDYASFRAVLPDRSWHATFGEWEKAAEQKLQQLRAQGIVAIKAKVNSNDFVAWCIATGRNIDSDALVAWANEAAARHVLEGKTDQ